MSVRHCSQSLAHAQSAAAKSYLSTLPHRSLSPLYLFNCLFVCHGLTDRPDWNAGGLQMNGIKDLGHLHVGLRQGSIYLFCYLQQELFMLQWFSIEHGGHGLSGSDPKLCFGGSQTGVVQSRDATNQFLNDRWQCLKMVVLVVRRGTQSDSGDVELVLS